MITLITGEQVETVRVNKFEDITTEKRLFYELIEEHKRTGEFKEIKDVANFIKQEKYLQEKNILHNCSEQSYINHHNFQTN